MWEYNVGKTNSNFILRENDANSGSIYHEVRVKTTTPKTNVIGLNLEYILRLFQCSCHSLSSCVTKPHTLEHKADCDIRLTTNYHPKLTQVRLFVKQAARRDEHLDDPVPTAPAKTRTRLAD